MSEATSTLQIRIGSSGDFAAFKAAQAQAEELRRSVEGVRTTLEALGVSLGLGGLIEGFRKITEMSVSIVDLSNRLQISTTAFQVLSQVAHETGLNANDMTSILGRLRGTLDTAAEGGGKAAKAMEDLGLNAKVLAGVPLEVALQAIAVQVMSATDHTKAFADATEILGVKNVPKLTEALKDLASGGYDKTKNSMSLLSEETLKDVKKMDEEWSTFARNAELAGTRVLEFYLKLNKVIQEGPANVLMEAVLKAGHPKAPSAASDADSGSGAAGGGLDAAKQAIALSQAANTGQTALKEDQAEINGLKQAQLGIEKMILTVTEDQNKARKQEAAEDARDIAETIRQSNEDIAAETKKQNIIISGLEAQEKEHEKLVQISLAAVQNDYTLTDTQKWEEKRAIIEANVKWLTAYQEKQQEIANNPLNPTDSNRRAQGAADQAGTSIASAQGQLAGMGPDPNSFTQNLSADLTKLQNQWGTLQQSMASGLTGVVNAGMQSIENNITKVIQGTETWRKALMNIVSAIEGAVVSSFVQMGVKWVATQVMMAVEGKATAAASAAAMIPIAMAESEVWAAPAALATIASWGGAAVAAPELVLASMMATQAMAGFAAGGYTGGTEGDFAGVVHGGEYVFSAPAVRSIGADNLERAHTMAKSGAVSDGMHSAPAGSSDGGHHFHVHDDHNAAFRAALKNPANRKSIVDMHRMAARYV